MFNGNEMRQWCTEHSNFILQFKQQIYYYY